MSDPFKVIESVNRGGMTLEVLEWSGFAGLTDPRAAIYQQALRTGGAAIRQVRITARHKSSLILEAGALQFFAGDFSIENKIQAGKIARRVFGSMMTGEKLFRPTYKGVGQIWLEPSIGHFLLMALDNEAVIVDQGMFHCCEDTVEVTAKMQSNISSAIFGGEGLFQTRLSGTGLVVLTSPVPEHEIIKLQVRPDAKVVVDGSFALLRSDAVKFSVQKSTRGIMGTLTSGEGLLQTFEGSGEVWVAPMLPFYESLAAMAISPLTPGVRS